MHHECLICKLQLLVDMEILTFIDDGTLEATQRLQSFFLELTITFTPRERDMSTF